MQMDKIKRPPHPFADQLLSQGLLDDDVRGTTTSSARRDIPSMVFGISTPGPLDQRDGAKRLKVGTLQSQSPRPVPVSRLGGTQFVMDDGDDPYRRLTNAGTGPMIYVDVTDPNEKRKGQPDIPYNESVRLRTRTGHQILLHNSEDLIYIGNSKGTAWVELTSNGKIDIYSSDSISIHTEQDMNFRADRDINLEAGRNVNIKAISNRVYIEAGKDYNVICGQDGKISVLGNLDFKINGTTKITSGGTTDIFSGGNLVAQAPKIDLNGPAASQAEAVEQLSTHENLATSTGAGWNQKYQAGTVTSIMKRMPMHEPWALHENQAPQLLTPDKTDREV